MGQMIADYVVSLLAWAGVPGLLVGVVVPVYGAIILPWVIYGRLSMRRFRRSVHHN